MFTRGRLLVVVVSALVAATAAPSAGIALAPPEVPNVQVRELTTMTSGPTDASFTADGEYVVYYNSGDGGIYSTALSTDVTELLGGMCCAGGTVKVSADGQTVVYRGVEFAGINRTGITGGATEPLPEPIALGPGGDLSGVWDLVGVDGSVVFLAPNNEIRVWWADGSTSSVVTPPNDVHGIYGSRTGDTVVYATHDPSGTNLLRLWSVLPGAQPVMLGERNGPGLGWFPRTFDPRVPHNPDHLLLSVGWSKVNEPSHLETLLVDHGATPRVIHLADSSDYALSDDGTTALFVIDEVGDDSAKVVRLARPAAAVSLPAHGSEWAINGSGRRVAASDDTGTHVYRRDGSLVRTLDARGLLHFAGAWLVVEAPDRIRAARVTSDGGTLRPVSHPNRTVEKVQVGPDGFLYWVAMKQDLTYGVYRARPSGSDRALLFAERVFWVGQEFGRQGRDLVFGGAGTYWALDVTALPDRACGDRVATMIGTPGPDMLTGTDGNDVIVTLAGADEIRAGSGHDRICAGAGDDRVLGERGRDRIWGRFGDDVLRGGLGTDRIFDDFGTNTADGGQGEDMCRVAGTTTNCELP